MYCDRRSPQMRVQERLERRGMRPPDWLRSQPFVWTRQVCCQRRELSLPLRGWLERPYVGTSYWLGWVYLWQVRRMQSRRFKPQVHMYARLAR